MGSHENDLDMRINAIALKEVPSSSPCACIESVFPPEIRTLFLMHKLSHKSRSHVEVDKGTVGFGNEIACACIYLGLCFSSQCTEKKMTRYSDQCL